ncbi:MAG: RNA methyltransferase [Candidatus Cloacimonadota bacterium]|nr:RNA methyltransferase [Candidatus Cloacimonadota bacterium]
MNTTAPEISKNRIRELSKLQQKKQRLSKGKVVVEGLRTLKQLRDWGIKPLEQYCLADSSPVWTDVPSFVLRDWELGKICDSEHPQDVAALFDLPRERKIEFKLAFYLDGIKDPGNLGTIFRLCVAFGIDALLLSPDCVEVSSPKVVRASLGSVFKVPFQILDAEQLCSIQAELVLTDASSGEALRSFIPNADRATMIALGSEAHGLSEELRALADRTLRIEMGEWMESLNVAVSAGIIAHHLFGT